MNGLPKIPRRITLPGHYHIRVMVVTQQEAKKTVLEEDSHACWCVELHTIYLRKSRTGMDRIDDFLHEMEHAVTDWKDAFRGRTETD